MTKLSDNAYHNKVHTSM